YACGGSSHTPSSSGGSPDAGTPGGGSGGPKRFAVAVAATGSGRITSTPGGLDCATSCSASFDAGTHLSLAATPSAGWQFAGWGGACSGTGACDLTVTADVSVSATFSQNPPPPPDACADIAAPSDETMLQYVVSQDNACLPGAGDAT